MDSLNALTTIRKLSLSCLYHSKPQQPHSFVKHTADVRLLGAFKYRPEFDVDPSCGHALYNAEAEFTRMGLPNKDWQILAENQDYTVCVTEYSDASMHFHVDI